MEDNLKIILNKFEQLKGQFVITCSWEIERFVAISTDDLDYYYVTYDGRKFTYNTCVGRIMPLKGKLDKEDYDELVRIAKLNDFDPALKDKDVINMHRKELLSVLEDNTNTMKLLTKVCWEIN